MKNKKLLTLATLAGLTIGGLSLATTASAQSYGGDQEAPAAETTESSTADANAVDQGRIVQVQEANDGEAPDGQATDGQAPDGERVSGERHGRRGQGGCNLTDAAEAIGIDEADLRTALDDGQTIAEVAEANGVDADSVIDAMVQAKAEHLAEKVDEGRLTQDEADEKLAESTDRITDRVNGVTEGSDA